MKQVSLGKKPERKVKLLEERIQKAIDRHYDLYTWAINDALMTETLRVRSMEHLIDCAQKLRYFGADKNLERELALAKEIRDQTWDDVKDYLSYREKQKWRNWFNPTPPKPKLPSEVVEEPTQEEIENAFEEEVNQVMFFNDKIDEMNDETA